MTDTPTPDETPTNERGRFGLTAAEYESLVDMLRYMGSIFAAVAIALIVVALLSLLWRG